ncbi:hypothetical protein ACOMHN_013458 [Nucella lapillus]
MASSSTGKNRSAATKGVVVWEWFNEHGKWRPYSPEIVAFIEKEGQNTTQVSLANVSAALKMYTVDIPSMCQIRKGTGTSRPVRRVIYPWSSPAAQQVTWEYEGDQAGQWVAYDLEISACLEQAQQTQQQMLDMSTLFNLPYSVHFTTMQQVRINTGRTRKIRRSPLQTPYPSAAKSPRCYSKLTTILPTPAFTIPSGSQSQSQPQPSTSAQNGSLPSSSGSAAAHHGAGSNDMKRGRSAPLSSDSDSDSDSDGMTLRLRTRQYKRLKKSHSHGAGFGKKSAKDIQRSGVLSASGGAAGPPLTSGAGPASISSQSLVSQSQQQQVNGLAPSSLPLPLTSSPFPLSSVPMASAGSTLPLNLLTYAQPLAANLSQGFPPMTHLPPPLQLPPSSSSSRHPHTQAQAVVQIPQSVPSVSPAKGQTYTTSMIQAPPQASSRHSSRSAMSHLGPPSHSHGHALSSSSSSSSSSGQGAVGAYSLLGPPQSSGSWSMVPGSVPLHLASLVPHPSMVSSQPVLMTSIASASSQPSLAPPTTSLPSSSQVSMSTYQGPVTRKRMLKQMGVGGGGGGGMLGGGGLNSSHHPLIGGSLPHTFTPSQPQPHPGAVSVNGLNPLHAHPHYHLPHQLPPPPQTQLSAPPPPTQPQPPPPSSHSQHLQQIHHFQQQQQQQSQYLPGFGLAPSGYPFNQSSFAPTLGHNILSSSALLIPGTGGSGQHTVSTNPGQGSASLQQQANAATSLPVTETLPTDTKIVLPKKKKAKIKPKTGEEVLARYMEIISSPECEDCCICYDSLSGPSSYGEGKAGQCDVIQLNKCSHMFHRLCLLAMYDSSHKGDSLQCPTCKMIYGELVGNCPPGEMSYDILSRPLPGHSHCGTIRVTYYISPGIQGPEHPSPGRRFTARGFPRSGFLPDDNRGRRILKLLMVTFRRKLMFTIGMSATTGESDTVTWNEIHHKTEFGSNLSGHGYPDPNYLDNVTAELALKGVTEDDL